MGQESKNWGFAEVEATVVGALLRFCGGVSVLDRSTIERWRVRWESCGAKDREKWSESVRQVTSTLESEEASTEEAIRALRWLFTYPVGDGRGVSVSGIMSLGDQLWRRVEYTDDNYELEDRVVKAAGLDNSVDNSVAVRYTWLYRWTDLGFPTVKISPEFAAAAMTSVAQPEVLYALRLPWSAFLIEMPKQPVLYVMDDRRPIPIAVDRVVVYAEKVDSKMREEKTRHQHPIDFETCWTIMVESSESETSMGVMRSSPGNLGRPRSYCPVCDKNGVVVRISDDLASEHPWDDVSDQHDKTTMLVGRLVVGVVCALTDLRHVREVGGGAHARWGGRAHRTPTMVPEKRVYQLTTPITVNLVDHVVEYQLHKKGKWKLALRYVVRGHQKLQPCGPRHEQRKVIWVHPYWRGPSDAPIAVRSHDLKP
jgi:hypothetical protein